MTSAEQIEPQWQQLLRLAEAEDVAGLRGFVAAMAPAEAVGALLHLNVNEQRSVLLTLELEAAAALLDEVPDAPAAQLIESLAPEQAAAIIEYLDSDAQGDLIHDVPDEDAEAILAEMAPDVAAEARELAQYDPETAGGLMRTETFTFPGTATVGDVLDRLVGSDEDFERYRGEHPYIVEEDGKLRGVLSLRNLLLSGRYTNLSDISHDAVSVGTGETLEDLKALFDKTSFLGVPVTDELGRLVGVVSREDVSEALQSRADQDQLKMQGITAEELRSMPLLFRSRRRLSWLSINIVLNIIAASVIALYEETLAAVIALAVFLPIVSDMSGCSGNQAVAVSLRELTLGAIDATEYVRVWLIEVMVGMINGTVLGALLGFAAYLWKGNIFLGIVVGTALALNTILAVSLGGTVPLFLRRMGVDPAVASGPILTTVTDMFGFFLVLSIAALFLPRLI